MTTSNEIPDGFVRKYGWDGKPMIVKDESDEHRISIQYIVDNQSEDKEIGVMTKIFEYMDDLMYANKFDVVDQFILDFCNADVCFQYCLCLLVCVSWAKDKVKNRQILIDKTKARGIKEIGEKDTIVCLKGLI